MKKRVLIGLSGGVDSTVSAVMLQKEGYELEGVYMIMHNLDKLNRNNIQKAQKVADFLGIKLHIYDIQESFKDNVYDYFVQSYQDGLTPNPCVVCNRTIKFGKMLELADSLGIEHIATGHYVKKAGNFIYKGKDLSKDQSYFLARVRPDVIKRAFFPLGDWIKEDVKKYAQNIEVLKEFAIQKESSEVCFVEDSYIDILNQHFNTNKPGIVKDMEGNEVGNHKGFMHYTIGKRRGFFVKGAHEPHYVIDMDAKNNTLIVGKKEDLAKQEIVVTNINLFEELRDFRSQVKVRYRTHGIDAHIKIENNIGLISLDEPAFGVAKGQFAVFYDEDKLLGGAEIIDVL